MADGGGLFSCMTPPPRERRRRARVEPEIDIDLFCGLGGTSEGFVQGLGKAPDLVLNHSDAAIAGHSRNHPESMHLRSDIDAVNPRNVVGRRRVRVLAASPTCTHFSNARGAAPKKEQLREQGWSVIRWVRAVNPRIVVCENVREWMTWGPLHPDDHPDKDLRGQPIAERAGETWEAWLQALRDLGYVVEWRLLTACDYGAPTSRERLFVVARRDGGPMVFPAVTHGPVDSGAVRAGLLRPFVPAADQIDWTIPMCSIFATSDEAVAWARERRRAAKATGSKERIGTPSRPLAEATMDRMAEGMLRFVLGARRPFLVNLSHGRRVEDIDEPANTLTATPAGGDRCLVAPIVTKAHSNGSGSLGARSAGDPFPTNTTTEQFAVAAAGLVETGNGEREGQAPRVRDPERPFGTVTASGSQGAIAGAWVVRHNGTTEGKMNAGAEAGEPLPTVCTKLTQGAGAAILEQLRAPVSVRLSPTQRARARMVVAYLTLYYSGGGTSAGVDGPAPTIPTKDRLGLVTVTVESADGISTEELVTVVIDGVRWVVVDIAMRMLTPRELARCQGFPEHYVLSGTKAEQIEGIGNSVSPPVIAAILRALLEDELGRDEPMREAA